MIQTILLDHFKCFEHLRLPLAPLTLLTGVNAAGKSTVIQALALLRQNKLTHTSTSLTLNGDLVQLGNFDDVVDKETGRDCFGIGLERNGFELQWQFQTEERSDLVIPAKCQGPGVFSTQVEDLISLQTAIAELGYLCTDRIGPRETYLVDVADSSRLSIGSKGEFTPWVIHRLGEYEVLPALRKPDVTVTLLRQIEAWLADFFPGTGMDIQPVSGANLVLLRIKTRPDGKFHRPQNVGFGVTHILPVLTLCLGAVKGQVLVIENPEAHLHPSAQAKMGYFLGLVAAAGVQIIVESHSDHILNGLRQVVRDKKLGSDQLAIHFFNRRERLPENGSQIISPVIDEKGQLSVWPEGFFDQYEKDLAQLTGWT
jgi:predicted ATPase